MNFLWIIIFALIISAIFIFLGVIKISIFQLIQLLFGVIGIVLICLGFCFLPASMWRSIGAILVIIGLCFEVILIFLVKKGQN